ncbi:allatostatin-A receptor-like [Glandiceps talaboti]
MTTVDYTQITPIASVDIVQDEKVNALNDSEIVILTQDDIDRLMYSTTDTVVVCVLMPLVFIIGFIGNALTVYVFIRGRGMQSVTNMLLVNLAMADILFLLVAILPKVSSYIAASVPLVNDYTLGEISCKALTYLSDVTIAVSCITILILAIEKYLAIRWYVKFRVYRTTTNVLIVCLVVWLFCLVYMLPDTVYMQIAVYRIAWPEKYTNHSTMPSTFINCGGCQPSACQFFDVHYQIGQFLFLLMIPALLCIYLVILLQLIRTERASKNITAKASFRAKKQLIRMLVVTTAVFIICIAPYRILALCTFYNVYIHEIIRYYLLNIFRTLTYINSAANPIIYNALSDRYRQAFKTTLLACLPEKLYKHSKLLNNDLDGVTMTTLTTRHMSHTKKTEG